MVAVLLALPASHRLAIADDFVVEIGGTEGTPFGGTCLLVVGNGYSRHETSGTVPFRVELSADVISCAIQRKAASGDLRIVIKSTAGRFVSQSAGVQPFGVIMASGR
jgi:hypothetical protein